MQLFYVLDSFDKFYEQHESTQDQIRTRYDTTRLLSLIERDEAERKWRSQEFNVTGERYDKK